jgi:hypothetical protein
MPDENKQKYEAKLLKALYHIFFFLFMAIHIYHMLEIISRYKCHPGGSLY